MNDAARAVEFAARASYGKLLALLAARCHDITLAEDMLADAFAKALTVWATKGVPDNPDAWLFTVARNSLTDRQRHATRFPVVGEFSDMPADIKTDEGLPDARLALLMVCAHPAIAPDLHTPMMLQTVLGVDAKTIARLFMVSPAALTKRLGRAKRKIRDARIPFQIPDEHALPERSAAIMEAIYGVHALDWLEPSDGMGDEALYLANLLAQLLPDNAEALGLAALIAFGHARRSARVVRGILVPIETQDTDLWNDRLLAYGDALLRSAQRQKQVGRFQLEAAIQSVHILRKQTGQTDWDGLNRLYFAYAKIAPSMGCLVAQAVVTAHLHGPQAGLEALIKIEDGLNTAFQPLWAARADLLLQCGEIGPAADAYEKAISLATDAPVREWLKMQKAGLKAP